MIPCSAVQTKKDTAYRWKALRLTARQSLMGLTTLIEPMAKIKPSKRKDVDLEDVVHKLLPVCLP